MQTFLPYSDFKKTFSCLDYRRLGKQRLESRQIWNIITGNTDKKGWISHPAVLMWRGYSNALAEYHNLCISEWVKRGYKNNMCFLDYGEVIYPWWLGWEAFHSSHRQTLLYKDFNYYNQFGWSESPKYEYIWPSKKGFSYVS